VKVHVWVVLLVAVVHTCRLVSTEAGDGGLIVSNSVWMCDTGKPRDAANTHLYWPGQLQ